MRSDAELAAVFDSLVGQEQPGACEGCDAYATVETVDHGADCPAYCHSYLMSSETMPGDWWWIVHHTDDHCHMWRAVNARSN